jgi:hypothetical protein
MGEVHDYKNTTSLTWLSTLAINSVYSPEGQQKNHFLEKGLMDEWSAWQAGKDRGLATPLP